MYVYLRNTNSNKCGALKNNLQSQYALQNNQYPKSISKTTDVLTNHKWDDKYKLLEKKNGENSSNSSQHIKTDNDDNKRSLAQTSGCANEINVEELTCFCCGEKRSFFYRL